MSKFILITGGARSGKSNFALTRAKEFGKRRIFVATARVTDPEMAVRIERHKAERDASWESREEPVKVVSLLQSLSADTDLVLLDCITVFLSNLLIETQWSDADILGEVDALAETIIKSPFSLIAVTNEVGMGLVPADSLGRRFRDLAGLANQKLAEMADEVYLLTTGIPLCIKGEERR